jgi:tyrosinase
MSQQTYPITGIPVSGGPLPVRKEISSWYADKNNEHQVSLFIQALMELQATPIENQLSYFQLAGLSCLTPMESIFRLLSSIGIHSYPLVGWDGESPAPPPDADDPPGYCAHNKVTFPTWHRPYILLYEVGDPQVGQKKEKTKTGRQLTDEHSKFYMKPWSD